MPRSIKWILLSARRHNRAIVDLRSSIFTQEAAGLVDGGEEFLVGFLQLLAVRILSDLILTAIVAKEEKRRKAP